MGQRWCCARQSDWHEKKWKGRWVYECLLVHCNTDRYAPPTLVDKPSKKGTCLVNNCAVSFQMCSTCRKREGITREILPHYPNLVLAGCRSKNSLKYNARSATCRSCWQRVPCIMKALRGATLIKLRTRKG